MQSTISELLQYLDEQRAVLHAAVASVPADHHRTAPGEGRWSVANVLEHLAMVETRIATMLRPKIAEARAAEPSSVAASAAAPLDMARLIDRTRKIQSPPTSQPSGALDTTAALAALEQSRAAMRETVLAAEGAPLQAVVAPHPVFGPLDLGGWIRFVGGHEARHAAQIREIGDSLDARA